MAREDHPGYHMFMSCLSHCVFVWNEADLQLLRGAKRDEIQTKGISNPTYKQVTSSTTPTITFISNIFHLQGDLGMVYLISCT